MPSHSGVAAWVPHGRHLVIKPKIWRSEAGCSNTGLRVGYSKSLGSPRLRPLSGMSAMTGAVMFPLVPTISVLATVAVVRAVRKSFIPPDPAKVLKLGPPRSCMRDESTKDSVARELENALVETMKEQIASGRQVGIAVSVYLHGKEIANVCGGIVREASPFSDWRPVERDTLFPSFSVAKGIAATALMTCVDAKEVR